MSISGAKKVNYIATGYIFRWSSITCTVNGCVTFIKCIYELEVVYRCLLDNAPKPKNVISRNFGQLDMEPFNSKVERCNDEVFHLKYFKSYVFLNISLTKKNA